MNFTTTTATASDPFDLRGPMIHPKVRLAGTGAISATVTLQGSDFPSSADAWQALCTFTLSGTTTVNDSATPADASWAKYRWNCSAISGTGATLNCSVRGV